MPPVEYPKFPLLLGSGFCLAKAPSLRSRPGVWRGYRASARRSGQPRLLCVGVMLLGSLLYPTFQDFCLLKSCMIKTILDFSFFQFEKRSFRGV